MVLDELNSVGRRFGQVVRRRQNPLISRTKMEGFAGLRAVCRRALWSPATLARIGGGWAAGAPRSFTPAPQHAYRMQPPVRFAPRLRAYNLGDAGRAPVRGATCGAFGCRGLGWVPELRGASNHVSVTFDDDTPSHHSII